MAAAAILLGVEPLWAMEIARAAAASLVFGFDDPEDTVRETIAHRRRTPGAGRPARFHADLPPVEDDALIARAMVAEWSR